MWQGKAILGTGTSTHITSVCRPVRCVPCARHSCLRRSVLPVATASGSATDPATERSAPFINIIPKSQWPNGVPPVMGAHLMASGIVAPISTSTGADDAPPHVFRYPDGETTAGLQLYVTAAAAAKGLSKTVAGLAKQAIANKGSFTLVLSGGSLINSLSSLAQTPGIDFSKWWVFFVDERNVPHDHPDSNFKGANDALLSQVPIPAEQVIAITPNLPVEQAARAYEGALTTLPAGVLPKDNLGRPVFDAILLGVGPDGHVASLFPNRKQTASTSPTVWVLPISDSPKPPPERITFTFPVINAAKDVLIVALGAGKAEVVQRVLEVQALPGALPAQMVRPDSGSLKWVLDVEAAQNLRIEDWDNISSFPRNK